ncbi:hypothetical protein [Sphingomonas sp. MMS24-J13]|uniref:hypothetical protein n=1 Tax=Sphingomonas sp. MMS24-J13 TaxID=3238686 RepID=UPI00384B97C4
MKDFTAGKLSIVLGGGIFGVALAGVFAGLLGAPVPLAIEGVSALAGMLAGAKVA